MYFRSSVAVGRDQPQQHVVSVAVRPDRRSVVPLCHHRVHAPAHPAARKTAHAAHAQCARLLQRVRTARVVLSLGHAARHPQESLAGHSASLLLSAHSAPSLAAAVASARSRQRKSGWRQSAQALAILTHICSAIRFEYRISLCSSLLLSLPSNVGSLACVVRRRLVFSAFFNFNLSLFD